MVVPAIESEGGVVDKYIGDGIMALFGAPEDRPEHALRAARSVAIPGHIRRWASSWASRPR